MASKGNSGGLAKPCLFMAKGLSRVRPLSVLGLTAIVYLATAGGRAVIDYDEGYYAQAALQMVERGDWVTPYVNGVRFLEKPPLMYWVTAASFRAFGVNEFALRLPTALAVIALVWLVMLIARRTSGQRAAVIAGLATALSAGAYLFTRESLHDVWLVLFVTLAMYAFLDWYLDPRHSLVRALLFYAATAGAVMCKSLVGIAFPVGIAALFFLLQRERPKWRSIHLLPGSMLFLALTVPWHWLATMRNPEFLWYFFVNEQFLRFVNMHDPPVVWSLPLVTFWALLPVWFFPWTAFLPAAVQTGRKPADSREQALVRLVIAWSAVILGFFSISGRLEHYAFPVLPALSLLVGVALSRTDENKAIAWSFRGLAALGVAALLAGVGSVVWLAVAGHGPGFPSAAPTSRIYQTDFSILAEMPESIQRSLLKPAIVTIAALAAGFLAALHFETHCRRMRAVMAVAAVMVVLCGTIQWSLKICEGMISSKEFALAVAREARPGDRLVVVGDYESANSLSFYQPLRVEVFDGAAYALIPGMKFADSPKIVLTTQEFESAWKSPTRVFALAPKARLGELKLHGIEVMEVLDRVLLRNQ